MKPIEETIKEVIALLEKYHPESNQYTEVKNYWRYKKRIIRLSFSLIWQF